jgi:putative FmdB family regulatory protein
LPIYSYDCPTHGVFDLIRPIQKADDPSALCEICDATSPRVTELVAVQPDSLWHFGERVQGREINSRSQLERHNRQHNLLTLVGQSDRDAIRKMAEDGKREKAQKAAAERREVFEQTAAGSGLLNSFGELTPEAAKPL